MHRREFLALGLTVGASALAAGCGAQSTSAAVSSPQAGGASQAGGGSEEQRLNALLERIFHDQLRASPENATSFGLDQGENASARSQLDERSVASDERRVRARKDFLAQLRAIDRTRLSKIGAVNYDCVLYQFEILAHAAEQFGYGDKESATPYVLSQLDGAYQSIPDFLDSQHKIEQSGDAEAYIARLQAFAKVLDQETERATREGERGIIPPDFVLGQALGQLRGLRNTPATETTLVASLVRRTREKQIAGDWEKNARQIVEGPVAAALDRQIALLDGWRTKAVHDAGVWRLPHGDAYYAFGTKFNTTTNLSGDEIHRLGLEQIAEISSRIDTLLRAQGLSSGTLAARFAVLNKDPRFLYPNTEAGKAELLGDLSGKLRTLESKLPAYFGTLPKAKLELKRVPIAIEAGQPRGHYNLGAVDGSRPGIYYINLRGTAEWPKWFLPTFAFHEGSPGHHLQGSLALEVKDMPMLRKTTNFGAYAEGWALYAEQLADEMGMYDNDPLGRVGFLQSLLFRALRLVLDSGLHAKRWSRERAIQFGLDTIGGPEIQLATEVERYVLWPGQACSYKIGHTRWLALRQYAKEKLGSKFDIRKFHDAALLSGSMPLEVLERTIHDWVASAAG